MAIRFFCCFIIVCSSPLLARMSQEEIKKSTFLVKQALAAYEEGVAFAFQGSTFP